MAHLISQLSLWQWAAVFCGVLLAYIVFGIAGFGTALVAGPLLAQFMPLAHIVPLLALLDFTAAASNLLRDGRQADLGELKRMGPLMVVGSGIGAAILLWSQPAALMLVLGLFAIAYALYSLSGYRPAQQFPARASIVFGLVGGIFSALFGSGGFLYAIYLAGRIADKERIRVTQSTLIGLSTLTRVILFAVAGVYGDGAVALTALLLAPAMLLGTFAGRHITLKLTRAQFLALVNVVILVSGLSLLVRYFS